MIRMFHHQTHLIAAAALAGLSAAAFAGPPAPPPPKPIEQPLLSFFDGKVVFISTVVDPASGLLRLKALFANPDGKLRPGVAGRLELP